MAIHRITTKNSIKTPKKIITIFFDSKKKRKYKDEKKYIFY